MKPTTKKLPGWVHIPLFVFMTISFWETGNGFKDLFGTEIAWGFSAAITMLLYGFTILIGNRRLNNLPVLGFLITYFCFSLFSFTGNFNAIYTNYQESQLYVNELNQHKEELNKVLSASNKALDNYDPEVSQKRNKIDDLTQQLVSQITDPARPGLGKRALELIAEIESMLDGKITNFGTNGQTPEQLAKRYKAIIDQSAYKKFVTDNHRATFDIRKENNEKERKTMESINRLLEKYISVGASDNFNKQAKQMNLDTVSTINTIITNTKEALKDEDRTKFNFENVVSENQEVGKIAFSFKSAFTNEPFIAFLFVIVCFFIDWAVVLSLLVFFGRNEKEPAQVIHSGRSM